MKLLQRLLIKDFTFALILVTVGLSTAMGLFELIDKIDDLMKTNPSVTTLSIYLLYATPKFIKYLLPQAILICSFIVFGQYAKNNEIIALKASGAKLKVMFLPFIVLSLLLTFADFVVAEFIAAPLTVKANDMFYLIVKGQARLKITKGDIWFMEDKGMLVNAQIYEPQKKEMKGLNIFYFDNNQLTSMIKAKRCFFDNSKWVLEDIKKYDLKNLTITSLNKDTLKEFKSLNIHENSQIVTDEMSFFEIYHYNKQLIEAGYENQKIAVDMYAKLSYPLTCVFTMLIGIFFSTRYKIGGNIINAAVAITISLFYWITYTMSLSLGYSGVLNAQLAAFIVPIVFSATAFTLYLKIHE